MLPPQRLYQEFLAVVRGIQYLGYTLGTILLLGSLFSGNGTVLLMGSVSALLIVGAVYLATQGMIAIVDLLSRIEAHTRPSSLNLLESHRDPPIPEVGAPEVPRDFFTDPPLSPVPSPVPVVAVPQPLTLGLPVLFTLAELEKKHQVRIVPKEEQDKIQLDVSLTQADQDHLAIIRDLRDQLRQQQMQGKVWVQVYTPEGSVCWQNTLSI
ncbi:MAG: hypothetical protein Q6K99_01350 [Thermostichales cyanobacterium BF4_bins_65]